MRHILLAPLLLLAACGSGSSEPSKMAEVDGPCANVAPVLAARSDSEPFKSLRGDPRMLGDFPLEDSWDANFSAFDGSCRINAMRDFFGGESDMHMYTCELYAESGSFDKEARQAEAESIATNVTETLQECLGADWKMEEKTTSSDFEIYYKATFEPAEKQDSPFQFTADPVYVEMSYSPFMRGRGGASGWIVELQFQEQVAAAK